MSEYEVMPPPTRLGQRVQLRTAFSTDRGKVTKFVSQLEYWLDGEWRPVVRYDHDRDSEMGHDVTKEGLHRDVYRWNEKTRSEDVTGPIPAADGFEYAEDDLRNNVEGYIKRFEEWHDIKDRSSL